ncbi:MAG: fimbrial protein [Providencia sp.]
MQNACNTIMEKIMKTNISVLFISMCYSSVSLAAAYDLLLDIQPIVYSAPENSVNIGGSLTGRWDIQKNQSMFCSYGPGIDLETISAVQAASGYNTIFESVSYDVFNTTQTGIGWIMGGKDGGASGSWTPLLASGETQVFPFPGGLPSYPQPGANIRLAYIRLPGVLNAGKFTLPAQDIAKVKCYNNKTLIETATIRTAAVVMTINARSCRIQTGDQTLQMGTLTRQDFSGLAIGQNIEPGNTATLNLSCDKDVIPFVTISDNNNTANESNVISLSSPTATTTAKGVAYQVFYNNQRQSLGPKSADKGTLNQFPVGQVTTADNQAVPIALQFKYLKTDETVAPGDVNASVTLTFSYQ